MESAARFIPNKNIPDNMLISYIGGLIILSYSIYYIVAPPCSYAWDLGFKNAKYDSVYNMYVRETAGNFVGINRLKIWVTAPENTTVQIIIYQVGNENYPHAIWTYRNGMFYYAGHPLGAQIEDEGEFVGHYVWRVFSESKDTVVHLRTEFIEYNLRFPHGSRGG